MSPPVTEKPQNNSKQISLNQISFRTETRQQIKTEQQTPVQVGKVNPKPAGTAAAFHDLQVGRTVGDIVTTPDW